LKWNKDRQSNTQASTLRILATAQSQQKCVKSLPFQPDKKFPLPSFLFFQPTHNPTDNGRQKATATNKGLAKERVSR